MSCYVSTHFFSVQESVLYELEANKKCQKLITSPTCTVIDRNLVNSSYHIAFLRLIVRTVSFIRLTCPCNVHPLSPHFYIVKLGFTGVYIFFLIFALKHRVWVLVRTARRFLTCTHNLCFSKNINIFSFSS